jgi:hypothetical protein
VLLKSARALSPSRVEPPVMLLDDQIKVVPR